METNSHIGIPEGCSFYAIPAHSKKAERFNKQGVLWWFSGQESTCQRRGYMGLIPGGWSGQLEPVIHSY